LSKREAKEGRLWSDGALEAYSQFPSHFIPTGNGGNYPAWTEPEYREKFLLENEQRISLDNYPLMGEFEVRHYPSPKEFEEGRTYRDVSIAIDSDDMHKVFSLSSALKVPFQIHYEVEDGLIPPFSEMLRKYPEAKVIWCHFAQIRFSGRAREFNPKRLIGLLTEFPNLYLDLAFGSKNSRYPGSGEYHARFWEDKTGWVSVIEAFPSRILSALDLGGDRMDEIHKKVEVLRSVISELNKSTREWVAYRAAWKLLFDEDLFLEAT
jgi:hypothetical protein